MEEDRKGDQGSYRTVALEKEEEEDKRKYRRRRKKGGKKGRRNTGSRSKKKKHFLTNINNRKIHKVMNVTDINLKT
jgi:hypothetical protein